MRPNFANVLISTSKTRRRLATLLYKCLIVCTQTLAYWPVQVLPEPFSISLIPLFLSMHVSIPRRFGVWNCTSHVFKFVSIIHYSFNLYLSSVNSTLAVFICYVYLLTYSCTWMREYPWTMWQVFYYSQRETLEIHKLCCDRNLIRFFLFVVYYVSHYAQTIIVQAQFFTLKLSVSWTYKFYLVGNMPVLF